MVSKTIFKCETICVAVLLQPHAFVFGILVKDDTANPRQAKWLNFTGSVYDRPFISLLGN